MDGDDLVIFPNTALTQQLLAIKSTAEDAAHATANSVAVAVPHDFDASQRAAFRCPSRPCPMSSCDCAYCSAAAAKAGISRVQFIEEGVAAALAHNVGQDPASCHNATVLVYDAGAHAVC